MTTLSVDTFIRENQSGWGTSSGGETWTVVQNSGTTTASIASNKGSIIATANNDSVSIIGSQTTTAINETFRFKISDGNGGAVWRYQDNNNYYRAVQEDSGTLYLQKKVSGSISTITSTGISGWSTASSWRMRIVSNTTDIAVTVWLDGNSEPSAQINTTDNAITSDGKYGIGFVNYGGGNAALFDDLIVTDNSSGGTSTKSLPVRTLVRTQVTKSLPVRVLVRTQQTKSLVIRSIVRTLKTVSLPVRTVASTRVTKSLPVRTVARTLRTLSLPVRSVVRTLAIKSLPIRTKAATQVTKSLPIRLVARGRTLSLPIRTVVASQPTATVYAVGYGRDGYQVGTGA